MVAGDAGQDLDLRNERQALTRSAPEERGTPNAGRQLNVLQFVLFSHFRTEDRSLTFLRALLARTTGAGRQL
jgi:hypothetical protein